MPSVMGKAGATIKKIIAESGASVSRVAGGTVGVSEGLSLSGLPSQVEAAKNLVELYMAGGPPPECREEVYSINRKASLIHHHNSCGCIPCLPPSFYYCCSFLHPLSSVPALCARSITLLPRESIIILDALPCECVCVCVFNLPFFSSLLKGGIGVGAWSFRGARPQGRHHSPGARRQRREGQPGSRQDLCHGGGRHRASGCSGIKLRY